VRILVADDDARQLETICRGLFLCGHEASPARSAAEAEALLVARGAGAFDLLLAEITRPDDLGLALVETARGIAPSLPILIITGLTHGPGLASVHALGTSVLAKPFTPHDLDAAIRAAAVGVSEAESPLAPPCGVRQ
jgi:DNA-binding response OmpR family regulator